MTYRDVIRRMEASGNYSEAERFERILEQNGHSEYDRVPSWDVADGASNTRCGDLAEEAARSIRYEERREEERRQEEERAQEEARRQRAAMERQQEEDFYAQTQYPEQEPPELSEPEAEPTPEANPPT